MDTKHEASKLSRRPSTAVRDESYIRTHIIPAFGRQPIGQIEPSDVRKWVAGMKDSHAPATIKKAHELLSGALRAAMNDRLITRNPASNTDLPAIETPEMRFLDPAEIERLAAAIDDRYRALVITAAYTGCRWGELAGLRTDRLNLLRRTLRVEETLTDVRGHLSSGPPKTTASVRSITLPKIAVDALSAHLDAYPPSPTGMVFTGRDGGWLRASHVRRRVWNPAVNASVGMPCRFHDLRHSHVAMLIAAHQQPLVIAKRLGHKSVRTVLDVYGHLYEGLDEEAAGALDDLADGWAVRDLCGFEEPQGAKPGARLHETIA